MTNILQVYPVFPPAPQNSSNGITQAIYSISKKLVRRGHHIEVFATDFLDLKHRIPRPKQQIQIDGISVSYFESLVNFRNFFLTPAIVNALKRRVREFDVVHVHDLRTFQGPLAGYYSLKQSVPYFFQAHGAIPRNERAAFRQIYDRLFGRRLLHNSARLIALTRFEANEYNRYCSHRSHISIIPNGLDLSKFQCLPAKGNFKKKWGIEQGTKIILYIGRIHWIKGLDFLIEAIALLQRKYLDKFVTVLAGPDDGYLSECNFAIEKLGVTNRFKITGPLYGIDKLEALVDADMFVLPSRSETFPISILEAYACYKPVVASNVGGLAELVVDGKTGLLVSMGDSQDLANSLCKLLQDQEIAQAMGRGGKMFVHQKYDLDKIVDSLEVLYAQYSNHHSTSAT